MVVACFICLLNSPVMVFINYHLSIGDHTYITESTMIAFYITEIRHYSLINEQ